MLPLRLSSLKDAFLLIKSMLFFGHKRNGGAELCSSFFTTSSSATHVTSMRVTSGGKTGSCALRCKPSLRYGMTAPLRTM